jgi:PleD family two-component response regulator
MAAKTAKLKFEVIPVAEVPTEDSVTLSQSTRPIVLIVDDERIIADTLSMILSRSGFSTSPPTTVYQASRSPEAPHPTSSSPT